MSNRLGGKQGTAYVGTNANNPPNLTYNDRDPNQYDTQNVSIGDFWLNTVTLNLWVLLSLQGNSSSRGALANWKEFIGGSGNVETLTGNDGVPVPPTAGNINVITANATPQVKGSGSTETIDFNLTNLALGSSLPALAGGFENCAFGAAALSSITSGVANTAMGFTAGTSITSAQNTVSFGTAALAHNTIGSDSTAIGNFALNQSVGTSGGQNTALGSFAGRTLSTGTTNLLLGFNSGSSYTSSESSNIILGNTGVVSESNTIRIGVNGSSSGTQNRCFIAGIDGVNVGSVAKVVTEASNQLGTATITGSSTVTVTPGANTITLTASGSVPVSFTTDSGGPVIPSGGSVVLHGGTGVTTSGSGNTVTFTASNSEAIITTFNTSGTWTKNALTSTVSLYVIGGGGGGASGRRGTSTTAGGGAGGAGAATCFWQVPASLFSSSETVTIGAGGLGGAAQTTNATDGNVGGLCTLSGVGNIYIDVAGAVAAPAGTNGAAIGALGSSGFIFGVLTNETTGGNGSLTSGGSSPGCFVSTSSAGSGGGGAGADSGTARTGGAGSSLIAAYSTVLQAGAAGGVESGTINGTAGSSTVGTGHGVFVIGLGGGGGGGQSSGGVAGIGGAGAIPGGGGGGGGGSLAGTNSGAGGAGARGQVIIIEYFS